MDGASFHRLRELGRSRRSRTQRFGDALLLAEVLAAMERSGEATLRL